MATFEKDGLMQYKDAQGNMNILYPVTKVGNVEGAASAEDIKQLRQRYDADDNGRIDINAGGTGATTAAAALTSLGAFPAASVEYGTFTPEIFGENVRGVHTYSIQHGIYYKIGRLVFIWLQIATSGLLTAPEGRVHIGPLPWFVSYVPSPYANAFTVSSGGLMGGVYATKGMIFSQNDLILKSANDGYFISSPSSTITANITIAGSGAYLTT